MQAVPHSVRSRRIDAVTLAFPHSREIERAMVTRVIDVDLETSDAFSGTVTWSALRERGQLSEDGREWSLHRDDLETLSRQYDIDTEPGPPSPAQLERYLTPAEWHPPSGELTGVLEIRRLVRARHDMLDAFVRDGDHAALKRYLAWCDHLPFHEGDGVEAAQRRERLSRYLHILLVPDARQALHDETAVISWVCSLAEAPLAAARETAKHARPATATEVADRALDPQRAPWFHVSKPHRYPPLMPDPRTVPVERAVFVDDATLRDTVLPYDAVRQLRRISESAERPLRRRAVLMAHPDLEDEPAIGSRTVVTRNNNSASSDSNSGGEGDTLAKKTCNMDIEDLMSGLAAPPCMLYARNRLAFQGHLYHWQRVAVVGYLVDLGRDQDAIVNFLAPLFKGGDMSRETEEDVRGVTRGFGCQGLVTRSSGSDAQNDKRWVGCPLAIPNAAAFLQECGPRSGARRRDRVRRVFRVATRRHPVQQQGAAGQASVRVRGVVRVRPDQTDPEAAASRRAARRIRKRRRRRRGRRVSSSVSDSLSPSSTASARRFNRVMYITHGTSAFLFVYSRRSVWRPTHTPSLPFTCTRWRRRGWHLGARRRTRRSRPRCSGTPPSASRPRDLARVRTPPAAGSG
jgi:hypothetical protein